MNRLMSVQLSSLASVLAIVPVATLHAQTLTAETADQSMAPQGDASDSGEIVVTATRRAETVQNIPLSITAVTAATLERKAATNFFDYATTIPNLSFSHTSEGTSGSQTVAIRGIADANTTGFYIDDTPLPDSLDPRIIDVSRIEVLRGPQGTLYGARSMGGTVRLITIQPNTEKVEGRLHASIADTAHTNRPNYSVDGAVNIPVVQDKIGIRLVAIHQYDAGYFERTYGPVSGPTSTVKNIGRNITDGASASAVIKLTDNLTITPRILFQRTNLNGFPFADAPVTNGAKSDVLIPTSLAQRRLFNVAETARDTWILGTFDINYGANIGTFTSSSSYFDRKTEEKEDQTDFISAAFGTIPIPTNIELDRHNKVFTQEFRFSSAFRGPFQLVAGLFYTHSTPDALLPHNIVPGLNAASGGALGTDEFVYYNVKRTSREFAAYTEATLDLTPHLKLVAGARAFSVKVGQSVTTDGIATGGPTTVAPLYERNKGVTPKASIQYRFSEGNQVYVTAAKGFRPGGVNGPLPSALGCDADLARLGRTAEGSRTYQSDSVWSYELGAKTTLLDRNLTANASVFRIDWSDIQQTIRLQCSFAFRGNAGRARSQGFELELNAHPTRYLDLNLGFGYTDAAFRETVAGTQFSKGDRVPQVPKYTITAGMNYTHPINASTDGFFHADYERAGSSTSATNPVIDQSGKLVPRIRPAYDIVNLRTGVSFGNSEAALFVKNLTDELANLGDSLAIAAEAPNRARVVINQPRTIGIEFRTRF